MRRQLDANPVWATDASLLSSHVDPRSHVEVSGTCSATPYDETSGDEGEVSSVQSMRQHECKYIGDQADEQEEVMLVENADDAAVRQSADPEEAYIEDLQQVYEVRPTVRRILV